MTDNTPFDAAFEKDLLEQAIASTQAFAAEMTETNDIDKDFNLQCFLILCGTLKGMT